MKAPPTEQVTLYSELQLSIVKSGFNINKFLL